MSETWTITKLLNWCTEYFQSKSIESARLDSELLLAHVLKLTRMQLYLNFDKPLAESELATFKDLVKRRARQEPVAYILGKKEFWSSEFIVRPGVLVPRPDTEILVEAVLKKIKDNPKSEWRGFELGTGSGAIAITLLKEVPTLHMTAVEISQLAYDTTLENARHLGVSERLSLHHQSFSDWLAQNQAKFDFIVSNPPYISESEFETLSDTVRLFEPKEALIAPENGLAYYPLLAGFAKNHLDPNGFLAVEIGETQGQAVTEVFKNLSLNEPQVLKDYAQLDRVVLTHL